MRRADLTGYAVDIGGTKTAAAKIVGGGIVARAISATDGAAGLDAHLDVIAAMVGDLGWRRDAGGRLGVTVTGRVSAAGGWSAVNAGTLTQVTDAPLGEALRARFGDAVAWSNDAAATALAEYLFGAGAGEGAGAEAGEGADGFAYITVSTGVGGGLIFQGRLLESGRGLAGHLGFSTTRLGAGRCGCGRVGTVESVASGRAIAQAAAGAGHAGLDARAVFAAAEAGQDWARAIIDRSAAAVAELCANLTAMFDPGVIAIGGSVGLADGYIGRVTENLSREPALFQRPVVAARLGADGPLLGALAHGMGRAR